MSNEIWVSVISTLGGLLGGGSFIAFFKDRKKDNATAKLTDVAALQNQLTLLITTVEFLREENTRLQVDAETTSERARKLRLRLTEVEDQLTETQRTAQRALNQVDELRRRVRELAAGEDRN